MSQMQIQVNTDNNIQGREQFADKVKEAIENKLDRFADEITRVEVHLSDENSLKGGEDDKRCMIEARLKGRQPISVTHHAATLEQAIGTAANKLKKSIENDFGRLRKKR